jgi:hypothetical protein
MIPQNSATPFSRTKYSIPLCNPAALTQTAGLIFRRGHTHRIRRGHFVETRKVNELIAPTCRPF